MRTPMATMSYLAVGVTLVTCLLRWCEGTVQCLCSTPECQSKRDIFCVTDSLCYVQYTPPGPSVDPETPVMVRGCIDGSTPLLCENQRPGVYSGSWPILYCCNTDLCNKDTVPTLPSWASDIKDSTHNATKKRKSQSEMTPKQDVERSRLAGHEKDVPLQMAKDKRHSFLVNPLYVGVPVAGACVLMAIIIFAIYILRKQTQMYDEQYQRSQEIKRRPPSCPNGCRYVTITTVPCRHHPYYQHRYGRGPGASLSTDCDRSSNGSESRLLAHV